MNDMDDRRSVPLVIGIGNAFRSDDSAGLHVARGLARTLPNLNVIEMGGDAGGLMDAWVDHSDVIVVDALHVSGCDAGRIIELDARTESLADHQLACSTHAMGLGAAVELAKVLGTLPPKIRVYGIVGQDFAPGETLSAPVELAVEELVQSLSKRLSEH